jgi:hypothetical protein
VIAKDGHRQSGLILTVCNSVLYQGIKNAKEQFEIWRETPEEKAVPTLTPEEQQKEWDKVAALKKEIEERQRADLARANPTKEELLQQEEHHIAAQEFGLAEPRYLANPDSAQRLWTQLNGRPCTKENLQSAFNELVSVNGIAIRPPEPEAPREKTLLEQAAERGITKRAIFATPKDRYKQLIQDPLTRRLIDAVLAAPGN